MYHSLLLALSNVTYIFIGLSKNFFMKWALVFLYTASVLNIFFKLRQVVHS